MPGKNGDCAVKLPEGHDPHQLVRPSQSSEGKLQVGFGEKIGRKSIRAADEYYEFGPALIAPAADPLRQFFAGQGFAALIQRDHRRLRRDDGAKRRGLFGKSVARPTRAAFVDFADRDGADTDGTAGFACALAISFSKVALRPALETADRGEDQPHLSQLAHVLTGEPVPTSPEHALARAACARAARRPHFFQIIEG